MSYTVTNEVYLFVFYIVLTKNSETHCILNNNMSRYFISFKQLYFLKVTPFVLCPT